MIKRLLIANRGEIACRIIRSAKKLGITSIAVYSDADEKAQHVLQADEAYPLGGLQAKDSYLQQEKLIQIAKRHNIDAIHPGYGFLSENAEFAKRCVDNNVIFVGPSPDAILSMGDKSYAKKIMQKAQVPTIPGYEEDNQEPNVLQKAAERIGYPLLIKAAGGGGGKGMRLVHRQDVFLSQLKEAQHEAQSSFQQNKILLEKYLSPARHVEIQILADHHGHYRHIFSRDCSLQRRHQKVLEEAPAPGLSDSLLKLMGDAAIRAAQAVNYSGAGTIEFLVDNQENFYFMEMNTRLQVEHPVTELISGLDLVEWQLRIAKGELISFLQEDLQVNGHAMEVRLCAENPAEHFQAATGKLDLLYFPDNCETMFIRIDTGFISGDTITPYYDPLIAKIISWGQTREEALARLTSALSQTMIAGVKNNLEFLHLLLQSESVEIKTLATQALESSLNKLINPKQHEQNKNQDYFYIALAAIGEYINRGSELSFSPWQARDGWRLFSNNKETLKFWPNDSSKNDSNNDSNNNQDPIHFTFEVNKNIFNSKTLIFIFYNNKPITVEILSIDLPLIHFKLKCDDAYLDGIYHGGIYQDSSSIQIFYAGERQCWNYAPKKMTLTRRHQHQNTIITPMPCVVIDILVKPGDPVKSGDPLMIIEAMKMQNTLRAAQDGIVKSIHTHTGELLSEGCLAIELISN
jgi:3-methylcrotonyl-CoA carboxylase alpha subunit